MSCPLIAAHLAPSADEATNDVATGFVNIQLFPELVESKISRPPTISLVPSAEQATEFQIPLGRLLVVHAAPEFVEVKSADEINAASFWPFADEASEHDVAPNFDALGTLFETQFAPEFVEV
jgi:hypothetical protein